MNEQQSNLSSRQQNSLASQGNIIPPSQQSSLSQGQQIYPPKEPKNKKRRFLFRLISVLLAVEILVAVFFVTKSISKSQDSDHSSAEDTHSAAVPEQTTQTKPQVTAPTQPKTQMITLKVWSPLNDQAFPSENESFLKIACEKFDEAHPEWDIEFVFEVCAEGDTGNNVTKDPSAAADVYMFANDQLGTLLQANAIARLGGDVEAQVKADNSETMINSVSVGDALFGVPFTGNTWFMYYDKSVYTQEDIKSLDAMMAKKPVAFEVTNTWYLPAFYFAVGGTMYGDGTVGPEGVQFGGKSCAAATLYIADALKAGTMIEAGGGAGMNALRAGRVGAIFSGTWEASNVASILGKNYAAAQLPCITINGEQKQLRSFSGSKAFGVNPHSANPKAAAALAAFLGSAEMQDLHYQIRNGEVIPCSVSLLASGKYDASPAAIAQNNTIANTSVLQPCIPEMGTYWAYAPSMGQMLVDGQVNANNALEITRNWNLDLNAGQLTLMGMCGPSVNWSLDVHTGTMRIWGTGDMTDFADVKDIPWHDVNMDIKFVEISKGVTSVGNYAFDECSNLETVVLPDSIKRIGISAFNWCGFTSITIPNSVTEIGDYAFWSCKNLSEVTISSSLKNLGSYAFAHCDKLRSVRFLGNAPVFGKFVFREVTTNVYYPKSNTTWTPDIMLNYDGKLTWMAEQ